MSLSDLDRRSSPGREFLHRLRGCLAVLVAAAVLIGGGWFAWNKVHGFVTTLGVTPDYEGDGGAAVVVVIPPGSSVSAIGDILVSADVIKSAKAWRKAVDNEPQATTIQAGKYNLKKQLPAVKALEMLLDPAHNRIRTSVTVPEGLVLSQQIEVLAKGTKIAKKDFEKALKDTKALGLPSWAGKNVEGMLFPDTYEVTDQTTAASLLKEMVARTKAVLADIDLETRAKALHLTPYQAVVVASIIEREVKRPEDRPKVARVLYNRLFVVKPPMKLQLDSTVAYANKKYDSIDTTKADRDVDSPYNTYKHAGLPPGPISAPGRAALEAAVHPADGNWLYFVVVNPETGETVFSDDFAGQQEALQRYSAWCKDHPGVCS